VARKRLTPERAAELHRERVVQRWGEARYEAVRVLGPAVPNGLAFLHDAALGDDEEPDFLRAGADE